MIFPQFARSINFKLLGSAHDLRYTSAEARILMTVRYRARIRALFAEQQPASAGTLTPDWMASWASCPRTETLLQNVPGPCLGRAV